MKFKPVLPVTILVVLLIGITFGAVLQRTYDIGRIIDMLQAGRRPLFAPMPAASPDDGVPEALHGRLSLFVLAGQSNMSGRGEIPDQSRSANPEVFVFGNDYRWHPAAEPVDDPGNQVDKVSEDPDAGFGPGLAFAASLLEQRPGIAVGLIPCARGGSSIAQWHRSLSENTLYGSCLKRALAASTKGEIAGILFFQGEADAIAPELYGESELFPDSWGERFVDFVAGWRNDLELPELPVVYAQIGSNKAPEIFVNWAAVREQQRLVDMPSCVMIATDDLPLKDAVHFTTGSYRTIGSRFAEAYLASTQGN